MTRHQTSLQFFYLLAFLLILVSAQASAQDPTEPETILEPGVLAFELAPDLPSTLNFDLGELESALCADASITPLEKVSKQVIVDPLPHSLPMPLIPLALCTEITDPDRERAHFDEGQGVLIAIDNSSAIANNGITTIDLRPDILHFAGQQPIELSCGEWALEVDLFGDQNPSPAHVLSQGDHLGGVLSTDLNVELELLFTELQTGRTVTLLRDQTFSGAASWSSTTIDLGLADPEFNVQRPGNHFGELCFNTIELAARPLSLGWTAEKAPQAQSFCLVDWTGQGQLCLRPRVRE